MIKRLLLLALTLVCLFGCSSFQFGFNKKDDKRNEALDSTPIIELTLTKDEISEFKKKTDPDYEKIVANNRAILTNSIFTDQKTDPCLWTNLNPKLNHLINLKMKSKLTSQADAQKYINLLLSLLDESGEFRAVVVESTTEPTYFVGRYIFIGRKEIESCPDEAVLAEILSYRLFRNMEINKRFALKQPQGITKAKKLTASIEAVKADWETDSDSKLASADAVMLIMGRAGFMPSQEGVQHSSEIKESFDGYLEFVTPLQRHKKVFD